MDIRKILIANRGEIARRIIRTCRKMEIASVAIYSEADADMPYVREADEAVLIGPAPTQKSYLNSDRIIAAAKQCKVDAIHPGYGFLSENADFAVRCQQEGLMFIGPSSEVIRSMGSKVEARQRMMQARVPIVPGCDSVQSLEHALHVANEIGYPVMLKASAGGGGIGMNLVTSDIQLTQVYESTGNRAKNYFGDETLFLEKYIDSPRHIEVQIAADLHGNVVHLFERECSVQRRHQKVIEESPSPYLTEELRNEFLNTAVIGARALHYTNLGTMEFIFDKHGNFYFLEMNTRLQVEHAVTEAITDLDLVEWQIRIARGEVLPLLQQDIVAKGHAIECRLYAEDPVKFIPSPGRITKLVWPDGDVRIDAGVETSTDVTPFYDPMIAKLIVHEESRQATIKSAMRALETLTIEGIKNNIPLLETVLSSSAFQNGNYTTALISELQNQR